MDEVAAPGILAYKGGECFANLVSIINEIPSGKDINTATLEGILQSCVLSTSSDMDMSYLKVTLLTSRPATKSCFEFCYVTLSYHGISGLLLHH